MLHYHRALSKHFFWPLFFMKDWVLWPHAITQRVAACWPLQLGAHIGRCKPPLWSPRAMSWKPLAIVSIPGFQIAFPCIIQWSNLLLFQVSFCLRQACMVTSSPHYHTLNGNTKWLLMWAYTIFFLNLLPTQTLLKPN